MTKKHKPTLTVPQAIDALGGTKAVQALCGDCTHKWVSAMRVGNFFPRAWHLEILEACKERGVDFDPRNPAPLPDGESADGEAA